MNSDIWLMSDGHLIQLSSDYRHFLMHGNDKTISDPVNAIIEHKDYNELKISGPMIANESMFTRFFGINSTEQYMKAFDQLASQDKKILLNIDSPGGEAKLAFEFSDMIYNAGDQVVSYTSGIAASGGMLLYQAAQGGRYAHDSASLGSIGVIGYAVNFDTDDVKVVTSKNAKNKLPGGKAVQKRIDNIESIFTQRLSTYTQIDAYDIVKRGDYGSVFTGDYAASNGFVDELANYKTVSESLSMPDDKKGADKVADDKVQADAVAELSRMKALMKHPEAKASPDAVEFISSLPITSDQATKIMDLIAAKEPEALEPTTDDEDDTADSVADQVKKGVEDGIKSGLSGIQDQLKNMRVDDNDDVPSPDEAGDKGKKTDLQRGMDDADLILED